MHMIIRAIVYAKDKEEALESAKDIFEMLVERGVFDYYTTFDDDTATMSGKTRWGNLPVCVKANSKEGKKLIEEGMKFTNDEFMKNLEIIREVIGKESNEQIWKYDKEMFRHRCYCVGEYSGSNTWLYDNDGKGIRDEKHLKNVLEKWKCLWDKYPETKERYEYLDIWVIPADVHH